MSNGSRAFQWVGADYCLVTYTTFVLTDHDLMSVWDPSVLTFFSEDATAQGYQWVRVMGYTADSHRRSEG